tara:strand:- start:203 stop:502 length:300 start_codon:yes stop_codon:yes gene_type:complete
MSKQPQWHLVDAVERNRQNPDTFEIPTKTDRESVKAGAFVKLIFEVPETGGERMWVLVSSALNGQVKGTVNNNPVTPGMPALGDQIEFEPKHIIAIFGG